MQGVLIEVADKNLFTEGGLIANVRLSLLEVKQLSAALTTILEIDEKDILQCYTSALNLGKHVLAIQKELDAALLQGGSSTSARSILLLFFVFILYTELLNNVQTLLPRSYRDVRATDILLAIPYVGSAIQAFVTVTNTPIKLIKIIQTIEKFPRDFPNVSNAVLQVLNALKYMLELLLMGSATNSQQSARQIAEEAVAEALMLQNETSPSTSAEEPLVEEEGFSTAEVRQLIENQKRAIQLLQQGLAQIGEF